MVGNQLQDLCQDHNEAEKMNQWHLSGGKDPMFFNMITARPHTNADI
jgi:hypothetical protein